LVARIIFISAVGKRRGSLGVCYQAQVHDQLSIFEAYIKSVDRMRSSLTLTEISTTDIETTEAYDIKLLQ